MASLEKLKSALKANRELFILFQQRFKFGGVRNSVNITMSWTDSFTEQKMLSQSPLLEQVCCLYNYAVCCM
jgi:hypothetical protein